MIREKNHKVPRYLKTVQMVQSLLQERGLQPGDRIPSEREMAAYLKLSHSMVRQATDRLTISGFLRREHGRGTFLSKKKSAKTSSDSLQMRLGFLMLEDSPPAVGSGDSFIDSLLYSLQSSAGEAEFEFSFENVNSSHLLMGRLPLMLRNKSVDALLLEGLVTDSYLRFFEQYRLPLLVLGNYDVHEKIPTINFDAEALGRQMTSALLAQGRSPIWLHSLPLSNYMIGRQFERGYRRAISESPSGKGCFFFEGTSETVDQEWEMIQKTGIENAAFILMGHRATSLVNRIVSISSGSARPWLAAPPFIQRRHNTIKEHIPMVMDWKPWLDLGNKVGKTAIETIIGHLQKCPGGRSFHSTLLRPHCRLEVENGIPSWRLELEKLTIPNPAVS
jgi:DNA-binding transcriptional regulator YhcF (GntR family)